MSAFVISEVEIRNESAAAQYRELAAASIEAHGGHYLVRAAEPRVIEGPQTSRRIVIVEFPSLERARVWYASPEYARALEYRDAALDRRLMIVEGPGRETE